MFPNRYSKEKLTFYAYFCAQFVFFLSFCICKLFLSDSDVENNAFAESESLDLPLENVGEDIDEPETTTSNIEEMEASVCSLQNLSGEKSI